ncbi:Uncharacterized conserved protein [Methylomagnum ishizawai]|uniref:Uncharacterized conserved protein n=1 Tax=Methylomagnum ishizawai TaxID=1760988 RepID=A0A1Y6CUJ8_9GAMM|nr:RimK/LysX family protein [Methylomagnum ishizawai]SMF94091.1 Uncharacterized conserved protein [Methylomagnum ishizawai]
MHRLVLSLQAGLVAALCAIPVSTLAGPPVREKLVMGWLESVFLRPWNLRVTAKLDTGAKTSSLHADAIEHFTKEGGQEWVRFALDGVDDSKPLVVERPLVRMAYVKTHGGHSDKREVIRLALCKNGKEYETEFTLDDRSNFNYPLLLGRSFLQDVAWVDASATFLYKADTDPCRGAAPVPMSPERKKEE